MKILVSNKKRKKIAPSDVKFSNPPPQKKNHSNHGGGNSEKYTPLAKKYSRKFIYNSKTSIIPFEKESIQIFLQFKNISLNFLDAGYCWTFGSNFSSLLLYIN